MRFLWVENLIFLSYLIVLAFLLRKHCNGKLITVSLFLFPMVLLQWAPWHGRVLMTVRICSLVGQGCLLSLRPQFLILSVDLQRSKLDLPNRCTLVSQIVISKVVKLDGPDSFLYFVVGERSECTILSCFILLQLLDYASSGKAGFLWERSNRKQVRLALGDNDVSLATWLWEGTDAI